MPKIGIIGGSGLYELEGLKVKKKVKIKTPFGRPSSEIVIGEFENKEIAFLARHGKAHTIPPTSINYRANIFALKVLGVERIISVSACGSFKEELKPKDFVIPLQFFDRTNQCRKMSFFVEEGIVAHVGFSEPVCNDLAQLIYKACQQAQVNVHFGGVYVNMEGPQFSTLAESLFYKSQGFDIIGMTNLAESKLAREAEICYASLCAVTDYDCWHPSHETVTAQMVIENLMTNVENAKKILKILIPLIPEERNCKCKSALKDAIVTPLKEVPNKLKKKLKPIIGKYL